MQVVLSVRAAPFWLKFIVMKIFASLAIPRESGKPKFAYANEIAIVKEQLSNELSKKLFELYPFTERMDNNLRAIMVEHEMYVFSKLDIDFFISMIEAARNSSAPEVHESCFNVLTKHLLK